MNPPRPTPPAGNNVLVDRQPDGVTLTVPPLGLHRGGGFLFWWTLLWNAFAVPFTAVVVYETAQGRFKINDEPAGNWGYLLPLPFLVAGIISLLIVLHLGRRRAALAVVGDRLLAMSVGLFETRQGEWQRDQLDDIRAGPSGINQNGRDLLELQILPRVGAKFALLGGRRDVELKWLAAVLRQELGLGSARPTPAAAERPAPASREVSDATAVPTVPTTRSFAWIGSAIGGGILTAVLWLILNNFWRVNGAGLLVRQGWPWSNFCLCAAAGALIGCVAGLVSRFREIRHARQLAELCQDLSFTYQAEVSRAQLGELGGLPLFEKWSGASNRMTGEADGVRVEMLDYTYIEKGDENNTYYSQTLLQLPAGTASLPEFELRPRHLGIKMLGLLNLQGITFVPEDGCPADEREAIERFNQIYHLSQGLDRTLATIADTATDAEGGPAEPPADATESIRRLFTPAALRFFADHPGWLVQSDGRHLALWRRKTIVPAADRPAFLAEGLEAYRALTAPLPAQPNGPRSGLTVTPRGDPLLAGARLAGTVFGCFGGFFIGGIAGMIGVAMHDPFRPGGFAPLTVVIFFGGTLLGLVLGGLLGNRLLCWPICRVMKRRRGNRSDSESA
jgi:hypothetical protein